MTDRSKKITELTTLSNASPDDLLVIVDDPAGVPETKKITVGRFFGNVATNTVFKSAVSSNGSVSIANTLNVSGVASFTSNISFKGTILANTTPVINSTGYWVGNPSGLKGDKGSAGEAGASSSLYKFKANTVSTTGYPGESRVSYSNTTQINSNVVRVSRLTLDQVDIDIFLTLLAKNTIFVIQKENVSGDYQVWRITDTPTNINANTSSSYWNIPVALERSGGAGTTNLSDNSEVIFVVTSSPTNLLPTIPVNSSSNNEITLENDVVIKLSPKAYGNSTAYHLSDGTEGQLLYLVPATGFSNVESTGINIDHCRYSSNNSIIQGAGSYWMPFYSNSSTRSCLATLVFTDGYWILPHSKFYS